ncbi:MAG: metallopeptidase [Oscillospiraceae bacterium]|nr:metallopeptidase [Oscillospiraceae bacterium]
MDMALSRLTLVPAPGMPLATGGKQLLYDPVHVIKRYAEEKESVTRDYLHTVLHCVFRHMYIHTLVDRELWDLAADIAVETIIGELGVSAAEAKREARQSAVLSELREKLKPLTAEKIYRHYQESGISKKELARLRKLFAADDHRLWYLLPEEQSEEGQAAGGSDKDGSDKNGSDKDGSNSDNAWSRRAEAERIWKEVSERMQMELEAFSPLGGSSTGGLEQGLKALNREKYDYTAFLKKFAVRGEVMKINDDEFDNVFYTYGLSTYGNMPLIEPLEYKEVKRIRDFVIAIDTSGSVSGDLVQAFVQKTYNILKSTESFFSKINLHIIQCDTEIKEDVKITSQEELCAYLEKMSIKGFGGTDFRPVFERVDELIRDKELKSLKGLIYFTDGYGRFPKKKPSYEAAFVFVDDGEMAPEIPSWAIKLVLQKEEI